MAEYTFYKPSTGEITTNLTCSEYELQLNLRPGEDYIEGFYLPSDYTIVNGTAVEKPEDVRRSYFDRMMPRTA